MKMELRRYRRVDINGFNVVPEKFSFDLKKQLDPTVACACQPDSQIIAQRLARGLLQRAIHILNPYCSNIFFRFNRPMWLIEKKKLSSAETDAEYSSKNGNNPKRESARGSGAEIPQLRRFWHNSQFTPQREKNSLITNWLPISSVTKVQEAHAT